MIRSTYLMGILIMTILLSCQDASNKTNDSNDIMNKIGKENKNCSDSIKEKNEIKRSDTIQMSIHKEGMVETITAYIYTSPNNFPIGFRTYVPKGFVVESYILDEGSIVDFKRNEANLKMVVLPNNIINRAAAMQMAKRFVEKEGNAKEIENGYQLKESKTTVLTAEVGERNGLYYIWLSMYPIEYGDGFGPESHFIKQNLKWNE